MHKRFAPGEINFAYPEFYSFVKVTINGVGLEELQRVIGGATRDKAMGAFEVTQRAGDLEPKRL